MLATAAAYLSGIGPAHAISLPYLAMVTPMVALPAVQQLRRVAATLHTALATPATLVTAALAMLHPALRDHEPMGRIPSVELRAYTYVVLDDPGELGILNLVPLLADNAGVFVADQAHSTAARTEWLPRLQEEGGVYIALGHESAPARVPLPLAEDESGVTYVGSLTVNWNVRADLYEVARR